MTVTQAYGPPCRPENPPCARDPVTRGSRHTAGPGWTAGGYPTTKERLRRAPSGCFAVRSRITISRTSTQAACLTCMRGRCSCSASTLASREALFILLIGWVPALYYCFTRFVGPLAGGGPGPAGSGMEFPRLSGGAAIVVHPVSQYLRRRGAPAPYRGPTTSLSRPCWPGWRFRRLGKGVGPLLRRWRGAFPRVSRAGRA